MTATDTAYKNLIAKELPYPIHSEKQHKDYLRRVDGLMGKADRSLAEDRLFELLIILVDQYEEEHFPISAPEPRVMVRELMEVHGMTQADLARLFGSSGIASEVLSGKRELSKAQIKKLSQRFAVSPALFLNVGDLPGILPRAKRVVTQGKMDRAVRRRAIKRSKR